MQVEEDRKKGEEQEVQESLEEEVQVRHRGSQLEQVAPSKNVPLGQTQLLPLSVSGLLQSVQLVLVPTQLRQLASQLKHAPAASTYPPVGQLHTVPDNTPGSVQVRQSLLVPAVQLAQLAWQLTQLLPL